MPDPTKLTTDADRDAERARKEQKRKEIDEKMKEALLGSIGVVSLGMLIHHFTK